jgi:hypothetical protein
MHPCRTPHYGVLGNNILSKKACGIYVALVKIPGEGVRR